MLVDGCRVRVRIGIMATISIPFPRTVRGLLSTIAGLHAGAGSWKCILAYASPHPSTLARECPCFAVSSACASQGICPTDTDISSFELDGLAFSYWPELGGLAELAGHPYHARPLTAAGNHGKNPSCKQISFSRDSPKDLSHTIPRVQSSKPTPL
ncbi:hypothetical protein PMIN01_05874 [Paraphaeosphaeria minitans]|uniref:Uncharacterized protein n=1 Tax=Paraphaeosphaeria minitans TaxID=565426 RepID=A0A9P6GIE7_9PLEO|nr:hypothetical protein PMIN01_05874 [Paraphaeosphaeria minitans]